ncbi:MAG: Rrf2 family transcriptional regulator [Bacteroidales bacterium]|nr:Rrf2 family transcriptional regulator [Bacteroidales bacterium]
MISKSTEYAIRSLVYIQLQNGKEKRPGVVEIAHEIEAPEPYTAKILQLLTKQGLVESVKGRGGGFFFREDQLDHTLYNIIQVVDGDSFFYKCGFGLHHCSSEHPCPLHDKFEAIRDGFYQIAISETIRSLARKITEGNAVMNRIYNN